MDAEIDGERLRRALLRRPAAFTDTLVAWEVRGAARRLVGYLATDPRVQACIADDERVRLTAETTDLVDEAMGHYRDGEAKRLRSSAWALLAHVDDVAVAVQRGLSTRRHTPAADTEALAMRTAVARLRRDGTGRGHR